MDLVAVLLWFAIEAIEYAAVLGVLFLLVDVLKAATKAVERALEGAQRDVQAFREWLEGYI